MAPTKSGFRVLLPDGEGQVAVHHSASQDWHAIHNIRADFRRLGCDLDA